MSFKRSDLLRACYRSIIDSSDEPLLMLNTHYPGCEVPMDYMGDGKIILIISPTAVINFKITNKLITFKAAFSGVPYTISAPLEAVIALYEKENGKGIFFESEENENNHADVFEDTKPVLKVIDSSDDF